VIENFDTFYYRTYRSVLRSVVLLTNSLEDAHDHVQEAYTRAYDRWSSVGALDAPQAWVRRVAVNGALDGLRRDATRRKAYRRWFVREEPVPAADAAGVDVVRALRALPPAQRRAVVLHHLCDLSVAQIANDLGMPESTVKTHLSRGRAALATLLRQEGQVPLDV
jgi:RNA polymerase sigma-70 factor (sigma-E family)